MQEPTAAPPMLGGVVSPEAARLYLHLLFGGESSGGESSGDGPGAGRDRAEPAALTELARYGLARAAAAPASGWTAVDPSEALTHLLTAVDRDVATGHAHLGGLLRVLDGLRLEDERGTPAGGPRPAVEVLADHTEMLRVVRRYHAAARTEYLAVVATGTLPQPPLGWPDATTADPDADAARVRLLYAGTSPPDTGTGGPASRRPDVRTTSAVPLDMRVVDNHTAVLALVATPEADDIARAPAAVVVRSEPVVGLLRSCFSLLWQQAAPAACAAGAGDGPLTAFDRRVLALLATGHRDAAIARLTGTSVRTVRRRIAIICDELGVTGRFAAGVEAHRRALIP